MSPKKIVRTLSKSFFKARGYGSTTSRIVPAALLVGVLLSLLWWLTFSAPKDFIAPSLVRIDEGSTIDQAAQQLKEKKVIRSARLFSLSVQILGGNRGLIAGDYYFPSPENTIHIARRMATGNFELDPIKVTIPEGATSYEIADILSERLAFFDAATFRKLAIEKEGFLFPDTYYFLPTEDPETVVRVLEDTFYRRIEPLRDAIERSGHSLSEIVIMASLLEEEARTMETRRMISGILWHRIDIGMLLQVDAVFPYIIGKNTFTVTRAELQTDSPYNTYKYKGLPIGPISNPGLGSIEAAVKPIKSNYIFYLADNSGVTHYSRTYEEHLRKKRLYLGS